MPPEPFGVTSIANPAVPLERKPGFELRLSGFKGAGNDDEVKVDDPPVDTGAPLFTSFN